MARGDHLFIYRGGYSHHGIDLGDGSVVHFESDPWRKLTGTLASAESPKITVASIDEFSRGAPLNVRQYPTCDQVEVVVNRAESRLGDRNYDVFDNNCEHFAVWCKTGVHHSTQVHSFREAVKPLPKALATSAAIARTARHFPGRVRMLGYGAAMAVTAGSFAFKYFEKRIENYLNGES